MFLSRIYWYFWIPCSVEWLLTAAIASLNLFLCIVKSWDLHLAPFTLLYLRWCIHRVFCAQPVQSYNILSVYKIFSICRHENQRWLLSECVCGVFPHRGLEFGQIQPWEELLAPHQISSLVFYSKAVHSKYCHILFVLPNFLVFRTTWNISYVSPLSCLL